MHLSENISDYYFAHMDQLDADKQFHFCTRLGAWNSDRRALEYLRQCRSYFVPEPCTPAALQSILQALITTPPENPVNAQTLRETYFAKYPELRGIDFALFRVRHLKEVYGVDARPALFELYPRKKLLELKAALFADDEAVRIFSTYAINYTYLLERVMLEHDDPASIDLEKIYQLGDGYDTSDPQHRQLFIYLYTHAIIGETNFYVRAIPGQLLSAYSKMLQRLETVIEKHFAGINLDNKLEFLVCCRIAGYDTALFDRIYNECGKSLSNAGTFLVDRHNSQGQQDRTSLSASEHRNVLFIMSSSDFAPHSIRV
jgi:hypothetical protein